MPRTRTIAAVLALACMVMLAGCFTSRELTGIQRTIDAQNPDVRLKRNFVFTAGPGTMHLLERMAGFNDRPEAEMAARYLRDIDRVKIGIYDVQSDDAEGLSFELSTRGGWIPAVVVREEDQTTVIHYRERGDTVRDLLIVNGDSEQLVVVRLAGDLGRILMNALADRETVFGGMRGHVKSDVDSNER
jgi:hypothetical protein